MKQLTSLQNLIEELSSLPGIGVKTAQRLAIHLLKRSDERIRSLSTALLELKENIFTCPYCFGLTENVEACSICADESRAMDVLCVVEDAFDIFLMESSGLFRGRYHVLGGVLCPDKNIYADQLRFKELFQKIEEGSFEEVVMVLDADMEGDLTALYLVENLKGKDLKLTRIAQGIPCGGDLDYIDKRTLARAFENRMAL